MISSKKIYIKLFSCVLISKGYSKIILIDIQRKDYYSLSVKYSTILNSLQTGLLISQIDKEFDSLISFLREEELIFNTTEPFKFPAISTSMKFRNIISNVSLIASEYTIDYILDKSFIKILDSLMVEAIFIHINSEVLNKTKKIVAHFSSCVARSMELSLSNDTKSINFYKSLVEQNPRINKIYVHNSNSQTVEELYHDSFVVYSTKKDNLFEKTRSMSKDYLQINRTLALESHHYHTYFNRKLFFNERGEIMNAPECKKSFGNIKNIKSPQDLLNIISLPEFQKYWYINKQKTAICKDCSYKLMCVDERLPYPLNDKEWYHKEECNYNPYIGEWK
ncbi:SPASM domain peptide maturase, grasp-with-spasm system [Tenacibaculum sp. MAR_2009_124]|uniref:hypothetical protein n=1 Tax=Tenacibaculum sp. MAR_2009_124 TaxID=1250059 RepID=UPI0008974B2D|nr:hypothetical protein [Tenacibaculum sp. MAR_2009_124]SEC91443.1 SPASM domain peptide maturase, grasp-with-spasm system [Tenacibaculum sp. MAR_2009_124]